MSSQSWRIRDLQEMCARRVVACISQDAEGSSLLAQQLCFAPASVLEGLWAYAAESDRLSDALARAALAPGSEVGLVAFKVSGATRGRGRFADALATCAPALTELRFRDAPAVPASVSEFERGGWGADLPAASAPALGDVAALGALPRLQHVSVTCGDPRALDAALKLRTLNLASPSLAAAHVALALRTLEATLKTASLARTAPPGGDGDDDDCVLRAPRAESLHAVAHAVFGEVLLERCHQLVALSLDRCVVKRLACAAPDRRPHCPVLAS
ncbi:hypothetical protein SO694_000392129 [Aureococcus anophagefferens]|uniref:Uncharacterized protein n=1 Tax=Aureococcus anophagefferens TaxID=44056 RepID=A0ABR1FLP2_AURAN